MSDSKRNPSSSTPASSSRKGPEKKIGPYPGGIGVAIWLNTIETDDGATRKVRSITVSPRRYFDRKAEEWRDSTSFWPGDLPALIFALQRALEYVSTTSIPGQDRESESQDRIPF